MRRVEGGDGTYQPLRLEGEVDTADADVPEVDHRPLELVRGRHGDDLVIDIVQIAVCLHLHTVQSSALEGLRVDHAEVVLRGVLGAEYLFPMKV